MKSFLHYEMNSRKRSSFAAAASRRLRRVCVFLFALAVLGMLCIADKPVRADSISNPLYDVNGTMTITGNNVCALSPCTETVDFSFTFGYTLTSLNPTYSVYLGYVVPDSISVTSYGDLGSTFRYGGNIGNATSACGHDENYMGFGDSAGDDIQLNECGNYTTTPVVPSFNATYLWGCETTTCINDFVPPGWGFVQPPALAILLPGSVQAKVVAVPEGGTALSYLVIALASIGLAIRQSKRARARTLDDTVLKSSMLIDALTERHSRLNPLLWALGL